MKITFNPKISFKKGKNKRQILLLLLLGKIVNHKSQSLLAMENVLLILFLSNPVNKVEKSMLIGISNPNTKIYKVIF